MEEAKKIADEFLRRLVNFRPEDREEFFRRLKEQYCLECGSIGPQGKCHCTNDE